MFTSLASLMLNRPVRADVAMTGEITLRGLVLPIGGLKEKTLAALRAGIREVIVPKRNEKDMPDLPQEVKDHLKFHFVNNVDEVLKIAVGPAVATKPTNGKVKSANGSTKPAASPAPTKPKKRRVAAVGK
jgi:ATP-dependent Lon protease